MDKKIDLSNFQSNSYYEISYLDTESIVDSSFLKNFRKDNAGIFICPDANTLYGFTENLELISGFPLVGYGIPAFADINGDKNLDCITITIDKKLNAWNLR